jgi:hypothetical protein
MSGVGPLEYLIPVTLVTCTNRPEPSQRVLTCVEASPLTNFLAEFLGID